MFNVFKTMAIGGLLAAAVVTGSVVSVAAAETDTAIATRQAIMKSFGAHFGAIKAAAQAGDAKTVVGHATAINALGKVVGNFFPEGSGESMSMKTRALPVIWSDWNGFAGKAGALVEESGKLIDVAKAGGDSGALMAQFGALGKNACGSCHQTYRAK